MASKFGLAGGIPERRVRPVWDAIDSRQFKNALKLSTALLAKFPNSPYALALKALILERMGKPDEALSVCLSAKELLYKNDSILMDDLTLSTLQIAFQRLDHLDLATSCYEYACGKFPTNLELMMGLFNCYVREYSFVKQQQTAIKMYKLVGEERFLLWAVCSIQLQVFCGNGGEKLLLLAEGLLKKHVASHSLHEPEALIVYLSVLEQQAKYGDALEILSGKLGSLLMIEVDRLRIQGRLLARAGDYTAAASIFQKILELSPDDWECFLHYLGCLLEDDSSWVNGVLNDPIAPPKFLDCKLSHLPDEMFDSRISDASAFMQKLQADTSDNTIRCPYLANLEVERRKHLYGKGDDDKLMEALMQYFFRFGHLACFTTDVEVFVEILTPDKKTEFLEKLMKSSESPSPVPAKALGQSITLLKVQQLISKMYKLSESELEGSACQMVETYCKNLPLSKDLDPQESMYGEELLSMVCNVLVQVIEFVQFKERLQHSNQYLMARVEAPILQLKQNADNIEEEECVLESLKYGIHFIELSNEIGSKSLTFNEDLPSRPWWTPTSEKNYLLGPFEGISYYPREDMTKDREANIRRVIERKSLLPRMVYLSIQSASALLKENIKVNGSVSGPKISSDLKFLLERYAKLLGFSFSNAIEVVVGVSGGQKPSSTIASDLIDWLNFAVFLNAWNLSSHEIAQPDGNGHGHRPGAWHIVDSLLEMYVLEKVRSMDPQICSPCVDLPILVQLVTEPLAWHVLVLQSSVRSSLPSGKKKKKGGSDQPNTPLSHAIRDSIQSVCGTVEHVTKWLREQINRPEDENLETILSFLHKKGQNEGGPGQVFKILETSVSSINETQLGERISQAVKAWSPVDVARKIVTGKCTVASKFLKICESKLKSLHAMKQQIAQV
ncbi:N-terminal acetyltransferase B complex auxiliary subunit NAA25 isoform X2 [Corylus avellana]|uniref:N-terminal acetyltransferase B complex auxiliary subunit NAA25 isoform X2 n=1 Tax=Corylus avellana TaxID=13451 RepID=UPI00286A7A90|nr:N-terminal acetyltransferase B complex auxiliary subunit NAA25 isoform X2 [Corylus avellana]